MRRCSYIAALLLLGVISASPAKAATITFASQSVLPGQPLQIQVFGTNLIDVFAFGFDLGFDPLVLAFNGAEEGTFLPKAGESSFLFCPTGECPPDPPSVFSAVSGRDTGVSSAMQDAPELLATLLFTAIGAGNSAFQLSPRLLNSNFADISFDLEAGTITAVPEPSTLALLGVGLAVLARRRRGQTLDSKPDILMASRH